MRTYDMLVFGLNIPHVITAVRRWSHGGHHGQWGRCYG